MCQVSHLKFFPVIYLVLYLNVILIQSYIPALNFHIIHCVFASYITQLQITFRICLFGVIANYVTVHFGNPILNPNAACDTWSPIATSNLMGRMQGLHSPAQTLYWLMRLARAA